MRYKTYEQSTKISNKNLAKIKTVLFLILILFPSLYAEKAAILTDIFNPSGIIIDGPYIYLTEKSTVFIYSSENYKYINKFGREGQGPSEFSGFLTIIPQPGHLIINSLGKISFFSGTGEFIKELKSPRVNSVFFPLETGFIGRARAFESNTAFFTVNLYDLELKKGKEIYRVEDFEQPRKSKITFPIREPKYATLNNKIIIAGKPGFIVDILDQTGKQLHSITNKNFKRRKFTSQDEKEFREFLKAEYKERYHRYKQYLQFLEYFPEISFLFTDSNKIYVSTWRISNSKIELFEYDIKGKLLNIYFVNIFWQSMLKPYPLRIHNGKIYQLLENQEQQWELHISKLKIEN